MKYLSTYKLFEMDSNTPLERLLDRDIVPTINDIMMDVADEGINYRCALAARVDPEQDFTWVSCGFIDRAYWGGLENPTLQLLSVHVECFLEGNIKLVKGAFDRLMSYCDNNGLVYNFYISPSRTSSKGRKCIIGPEKEIEPNERMYNDNNRLEIFIFKK